jgi:hypothetical protein
MTIAFFALVMAGGPPVDGYDGRARQLEVPIPRVESEITVDGVLN